MKFVIFFLAVLVLLFYIAIIMYCDERGEQLDMEDWVNDLMEISSPQQPETASDMGFALNYLYVGDVEPDIDQKQEWYADAVNFALHRVEKDKK